MPRMNPLQVDDGDDGVFEGPVQGLRSNSNRISLLESNIETLAKNLEYLVTKSKSEDSRQRSGSMTPRPERGRRPVQDGQHGGDPRRTRSVSFGRQDVQQPSALMSQYGHHDFLQQELDREDYQREESSGKHTHFLPDIYATKILAKPYMYLETDSATTLKQKLDLRGSVTPLDYFDSYVGLLRDPRAYNQDDLPFMLAHLQDVIRDSRDKAWENVRRWSQLTWDNIEKGTLKWSEAQLIQNERFRRVGGPGMAPTGGGGGGHFKQPTHGATGGKPKHSKLDFPCRDFNSNRGCKFGGNHSDNGISLIHCCSYCEGVTGKRNPHSVLECENKIRFHSGASDARRGSASNPGHKDPSKNDQ